jgi:serine/threonine protein kinase
MMIGQNLGAFEIRRRLGKGGVGDVYLGFDTHLQREVAIKALRPEFAHDPAFVKRFIGEAQNLARLSHPNIATLYSFYNDGRELCMVMEYIDGRTLDETASWVRLPEADVLAMAAQAMEGLAYAHAMGLIHRDIKPGNLMINRAGTLKIMDFGIARLHGTERMTRQGAIIGSIAYMAPEQILGRQGDERSDIYSLAIVLYELLSGAPPFADDSEYALMKAQIETPPRRLVEHLPTVHRDIDAALMQALEKAPEDRFQSIGEFRSALCPVMINAFDAARMLRGRLVDGVGSARSERLAAERAKPAPETRLPEPPPRVEHHKARPAPPAAPTREQHTVHVGPAKRSDGGELWPRLALGAAATVFVVIIALMTLDLTVKTGTEPTLPANAGPHVPDRAQVETRVSVPGTTLPASTPEDVAHPRSTANIEAAVSPAGPSTAAPPALEDKTERQAEIPAEETRPAGRRDAQPTEAKESTSTVAREKPASADTTAAGRAAERPSTATKTSRAGGDKGWIVKQ